MQWQTPESTKPGIRDRIKHKTIPIPDPVLTEAKVPFFPRGAPPPRSPTPGTTTPGPGRTQTPRWASPPWRKTQCRSLILPTKGLCALLLELPPRRLIPTCRKVGSAPYSAPPSPPGEAAHATPAGGKLRRSPGRATSLLLPPETASPARDSHSRAPPGRPCCRRTRPGKSRGGESRAAAPVPRSPPTSRSRARRALPGRPLPSPWGKAGPRGSTARRRPRPGEPEAAREAGTLGLSGGQPPPSRARQDAWGLVRPAHPRGGGLAGPGPGPPPQAGRIRRGPRPRAGGGRVPAAGRAGRPAGGRRVAAAPGLK